MGQRDYRYLPSTGRDSDRGSSVEFIAPDALEPTSMITLFHMSLIEGREHEVTEALRILEPGVTDVERARLVAGRVIAFSAGRVDGAGHCGHGRRDVRGSGHD